MSDIDNEEMDMNNLKYIYEQNYPDPREDPLAIQKVDSIPNGYFKYTAKRQSSFNHKHLHTSGIEVENLDSENGERSYRISTDEQIQTPMSSDISFRGARDPRQQQEMFEEFKRRQEGEGESRFKDSSRERNGKTLGTK